MGERMFPHPQWTPETVDGTEPYAYCVFLVCTYISVIKLNLHIRHSKKLIATN